jgi:hypothetical protein
VAVSPPGTWQPGSTVTAYRGLGDGQRPHEPPLIAGRTDSLAYDDRVYGTGTAGPDGGLSAVSADGPAAAAEGPPYSPRAFVLRGLGPDGRAAWRTVFSLLDG